MIQSEIAKVTRPGNDVATSFSISPIVLLEPDPGEDHDLYVVKVEADGTETEIFEGPGTNEFTVVIAEYPGTGSLTFPSSGTGYLATGESLVIKRKLSLLQPLDLENQGGYFPDTLEEGLDRAIMILIQQQEELDRAIKLDISSSQTPEELLQSLYDAATDAQAAQAAAETAQGLAETAQTAAETAQGLAEDARDAAAISAASAAAAASSGIFGSIVDKSADFTVVADTDNAALFKVDTSGGNVSVTLPSIATAGEGERYTFTWVSASNTLTLVRNGSDTINGAAANYTIPAIVGEMIVVLADDASPDNWIVWRWALAQADGTSLSQSGNTLSVNTGNINVFTKPQRSTPTTDNDGSFDLDASQDFKCTPTGAVALTFTNKPTGQTGKVYLDNSGAYAITRAANVLASSDFNATVSAAGKYVISYWSIDGTTVALVATPALS